MKELINEIITIVVPGVLVPLLTLVGGILVKWLSSKTKEGKDSTLVQELDSIVASSVTSVYQTYVENLKKTDTFDKQAQMLAYAKAKDLITDSIKPKAKKYIIKHFGDFNTWLQTNIEAKVNEVKKGGKQ